MSAGRAQELMDLAVTEAGLSLSETDGRAHPKVGAVLADASGAVLLQAHRGEIAGCHAEFILLEKAAAQGLDLNGAVLFTTLEPCTKRGAQKIPCAERIANSGISTVYIGTADPNPAISGRGELGLQYCNKRVRRFDADQADRLLSLNDGFFASFRDEHVRSFRQLGGSVNVLRRPLLVEERNGRLQQTIDLMERTVGDVWISGGDLSWIRELQAVLLRMAIDGRRVRILTSVRREKTDAEYAARVRAALAIGVDVGLTTEQVRFRGCIANPNGSSAEAIALEAGNGHLLKSGEDERMLALVTREFERCWGDSVSTPGQFRELRPFSDADVISTLRGAVQQYQDADLGVEELDPRSLLPLTQFLEIFKVHRAQAMEPMRRFGGVSLAGWVPGSPWPLGPIVVEERPGIGLVVLDGTHRAYSAASTGITGLRCVIVRGVAAPLPAEPSGTWEQVRCYSTKLPRERRYKNYRKADFRLIRRALSNLVMAQDWKDPVERDPAWERALAAVLGSNT